MKPLHLLIIAVFLAGVTVNLLLFLHSAPLLFAESQDLPYTFQVRDNVGFDVGVDKLRLGGISPGNTGFRNVTVQHSNATAVTVRFYGDGAEYLYAEPASAYLIDGKAEFEVTVAVPLNAEYGLYEGVARFYFE